MAWLAQINISQLIAPITDPLIADFVRQIPEINTLAEASQGFVWRLKDDECGDATTIRPFNDELIIVNMSVWETPESLMAYVYKSAHSGVMRDRNRWFTGSLPENLPHLAMWWIPENTTPTLAEAREKLIALRDNGPCQDVFTFKEIRKT